MCKKRWGRGWQERRSGTLPFWELPTWAFQTHFNQNIIITKLQESHNNLQVSSKLHHQNIHPKVSSSKLVNLLGFPHGALYVKSSHVLPVLLEQRDEEIDSQVSVADQLIFSHLHMPNSHSQTQHLKG